MALPQQATIFQRNKIEKIEIHNHDADPGPEESKDKIIQFRMTPGDEQRMADFIHGRRGLDRSTYIRNFLKLGPDYYDHLANLLY